MKKNILIVFIILLLSFSIYHVIPSNINNIDYLHKINKNIISIDGFNIRIDEIYTIKSHVLMKFPTGSNYKNLMKFLYENEFFGYYRFINENEIPYRTTDYTFSKGSEGYLINIRFSIDDNNNIKSLKINEKFYLRVKKWLESIFSIHNEETLEEIYADLLGRVDRNTPPDKIDYFMKSIGANQIESEEVKDGTIYCNYKSINNCINMMNKKDIDNYTLRYKYEYPFLSIPWILSIKDEGIIFSWNFDKDQKLDHLGVS